MFGYLWNFIKRHKKKFIFGGFLVGGGIYAYRYAQRKVKEIQDKEASECLAHARRQHHFDSNQRTCNMTVLSMLSAVREALIKKLDTEAITKLLQTTPSNKLELWENLKIMSFTKSICAVYSCCILALFLRVQLNIIGGYLFLDTSSNRNGVTQQTTIPKDVQERYLSVIKYFVDFGIQEMAELIQGSVEREIKSSGFLFFHLFFVLDLTYWLFLDMLIISLKEKITLDNIQAVLTQIRERIEASPEISDLQSPTIMFCQYMLPSEGLTEVDSDSKDDQCYRKLLRETRDVLESPDFHSVLKLCLDRGFAKLLDSLAEHYKQLSDTASIHKIHEVSTPMAKLVPVMNGLTFKLCSDAPNPFIQELLLLEPCKTLAANIYEAFSQHEEAAATVE